MKGLSRILARADAGPLNQKRNEIKMAHPFGKPVRAAALCAAHSRTTRQVFHARKDQAGNCVYCSKKERSNELIRTKLYDIFIRPALRSAACRMHLPTTITQLEPPSPPTSPEPQGGLARVHPTSIHPSPYRTLRPGCAPSCPACDLRCPATAAAARRDTTLGCERIQRASEEQP